MPESPNERQIRHAVADTAKHLGRIADALEQLTEPKGAARYAYIPITSPDVAARVVDLRERIAADLADRRNLADDDGPDPIEAAIRVVLETNGHGDCSATSTSWDPDTGQVWCGDHSRLVAVGTVHADG